MTQPNNPSVSVSTHNIEGIEPASPPVAKEIWRGPVKKDWSDELREKQEAERLAAAAAPPPAAPPPRPVPATIEEARAVIARLAAEPVAIDQAVIIARAAGAWRNLKQVTDVPGDRIGIGKKLSQVIAGDLDLVAGVLMEQLVAERLRVRALETNLRDVLEVVAVLVKSIPTPAE